MRKPILIDYRDGKATFKQIAKAERLNLETIRKRHYHYELRGPELWAPSKRPRMHVQ